MGVKLIPDREINLLENDILGTSVYVEAIRKIIENPEIITPCTIGIFGSWGSGKTSIIKTLKEIYEKKNEKIKVFIYDAWKYSKDDFRRSFLIELADFLKKGNIKNELEKRFYTIEGRRIMCGISKFINFIINLQIETSKQIPNLIFPEKFSEYFNKLIDSLSYNHKLVIAIDNIDRCHKEQAFEILLTVKTFLGHEKVIFIIPVDDKGLKSYLQMSNKEADEFLRKLFNVSITIKSLSSNELYDYTVKLWDKYGVNLPKKETVISLICQEFSKNPRRIIQFLNTLQVEYNLALLQEEKGLIPEGSITNNIEMLVKLLILKEEYPTLYEKIMDDKSLLQTITDNIISEKFTKDKESRLLISGDIKLTEEEYRFLMRTSNIVLDGSKLEPFFVLKDVFKDIPDEIEELVISQDWDSIKVYYIERGQITLEKLLKFIETKIDEDVIKRELYDTSGFNLLSLILKIIAEKKEEIKTLPDKIISFLSNKRVWEYPFRYPPKELAISLEWLKREKIDKPLDYFIEAIDFIFVGKFHIEFLKEFIKAFKNHKDVLDQIKNRISDILAIYLIDFYDELKDIIESEVIKDLIAHDYVRKTVRNLAENLADFKSKYSIQELPSKLSTVLKAYIDKYGFDSFYEDIKSILSIKDSEKVQETSSEARLGSQEIKKMLNMTSPELEEFKRKQLEEAKNLLDKLVKENEAIIIILYAVKESIPEDKKLEIIELIDGISLLISYEVKQLLNDLRKYLTSE
ncbi:MAG: KAP family NTPase [Hydrogenobacter thermophilus]|uniref:KAP family P-loop NTPase fold protein n=1 Tax=Hydrogenobacter thermophilus TaxID=940 RepID=UPI001C78EDBF|nr:P-loop NTPase fold protein [Hydrogenobacter thermophilus]QWK20282.1 MAG: KAP family NTPase [Hydrogenobacter thermophilus]